MTFVIFNDCLSRLFHKFELMKYLNDLNLVQKRVLIRLDLNVPLNQQLQITDNTRILAVIPTLKKILAEGGKPIILSHLGRPKKGSEAKFSLKPVAQALEDQLGVKVIFSERIIGEEVEKKTKSLQKNEILLLENVRFHKEETEGEKVFAEALSRLGDIYINDAFGTAHRAHASTAIIADFFKEKGAGYVMQAELENAEKVLSQSEKPFTAIMGGAKISDKILIIEKLLDKVDNLLIGGGMAYTFFKAQGGQIGTSLLEEEHLELTKKLIVDAQVKNVRLLLPPDSWAGDKFDNEANRKLVNNLEIPTNYMGLDIGEKASQLFQEVILDSKTILWNGPMGVFEMSNFALGTQKVAEAIVEATQKGAYSLIGGGDSAAAINQLGMMDKVSYVSTGGGALLEYMEGKVLPGVKALKS